MSNMEIKRIVQNGTTIFPQTVPDAVTFPGTGVNSKTLVDVIEDLETEIEQGGLTPEQKTKLNGIESGAQVNVQSDWNQSDSTKDDYIKNKPIIPDISNKANKVNDAVNGNFAGIDGNGDLTDSGYKPSDYYIKSEVDTLIGSIESFHYEIYSELEDITSPQSNVLYLIGPTGGGEDLYEEYVYNAQEEVFIKIGDTSIDLSNYVTDSELATALASKQDSLTFDNAPTQNSNNPVKSGGIYTALAGKANASDLANYDSIIGIGTAVKEFHPNTPYLKGEFVVHPDSVTGIVDVYEFTAYHPAGAWTGTDVKIANIYNLFANYAGTDTEKVHVQLASSDGLLTLEGSEVTANFSDGGIETKEADATGQCVFDIAKGRVYTISVEQQGGQGYAFCPSQMGKATADDKYMYFEYSKIGGGYCVVKVYAYALGVRTEDASAWTGKQVQISLSDGTLQSEAFDANGVATFSYVPQNASGTIVCPKVAGYYTPRNLTILTGFTEQDIQANYGSLSAPGIYFTLADETDVDANALTPEDIPNVIALHIATETLINANSDFYVRPSDLWLTSNRPKYRWCEPNPNGQYPACPNVPAWNANTPYYDGKTASQNMFNDLQAQSTYSKVLDFAMAETLVTTHRTTYGFMPTRDQWQVLVDNYESVNGMIQMLDNTKSATCFQKKLWMATNVQNQPRNAFYWNDNGSFSVMDKPDSSQISWFCFFAI